MSRCCLFLYRSNVIPHFLLYFGETTLVKVKQVLKSLPTIYTHFRILSIFLLILGCASLTGLQPKSSLIISQHIIFSIYCLETTLSKDTVELGYILFLIAYGAVHNTW